MQGPGMVLPPGYKPGNVGVVKGPAAEGGVESCQPDTNDLVWITHDSGSGAAEINVLLTVNPPKRKFFLMSTPGSGAPVVYFHLDPLDPSLVSGGVLTGTPAEAFRVIPYDPLGSATIGGTNGFMLECCKPVSKIYLTHGDFGTSVIVTVLASDDIVLGAND